jgi:hypothetical protein
MRFDRTLEVDQAMQEMQQFLGEAIQRRREQGVAPSSSRITL